jgi:putative ABC transport system permease protein
MKLKESFRIAQRSLVSSKMRSFLTMLGIVIGVGAIIAMISIGRGAKSDISNRIKSMGSNVLTIRPGAPRTGMIRFERGSGTTLKEEDLDIIKEKATYISYIEPEVSGNVQVKYANKNSNTQIIGTVPEYQRVQNHYPTNGSFFTEDDVTYRNRVCVLGTTVATDLFAGVDPVGQEIRINNINFRVIGIMKSKGSMGPFDQDNRLFIPVSTAMKRLFGRDYFSSISVEVKNAKDMDAAQAELEKILRRQHKLPANKEADFNVQNQLSFLETLEKTGQSFTYLLAGIAGVSLIVGGIGIMNIMLVSVTERTREIGTRKAVGARRRDILTQFLVESLFLSIIGGAIGIGLGVAGARLISKLAGWPTVISADAILLAFLFSAAVGIFFGIYPARKAARLNPIEALRYE